MSLVNEKPVDNLVVLTASSSPAACRAPLISQQLLEREREAALRAHAAFEELERIRAGIRSALLRGVPVEPGLWRARLESRRRSPYSVSAAAFLQLVVE